MTISRDYCKYVNVFQGNGEIDLPKPIGIAKTWLFLKGQCGNTNPVAALPFGKMTCGPYTGGYSTGCGNHMPNSCGGIKKFDNKIRGFAHMHQSGTGAIGMYYNYAVVSPMYGEIGEKEYEFKDESASPGYYSVTLNNGILCETTVSKTVAFHRYTFDGNGKVVIDFSNDGLIKKLCKKYFGYSEGAVITIESENEISANVNMQGVALYIYVKCEGINARLWIDYKESEKNCINIHKTAKAFGGVFDAKGETLLKVAISTKSKEKAKSDLYSADYSFDEVKDNAYSLWNKYLNSVQISADEETMEIFYSNFYHSLIKPSNWQGESFLYDHKEFYCDFATMWDIYKTQLPLVFTLYKDETKGILETFFNVGEELGYLPVNLTMCNNFDVEQQQACMLTEHSMADIYYRYDNINAQKILAIAKKDLEHWNQAKNSKRYTHILDMAEACAAMGKIASEIGENVNEFLETADMWRDVFDNNTGLLSDKSEYYEGDLWNYSFRLLHNMEERVQIAGGKEAYIKLLDQFFGYTREAVLQPTKPDDYEYLETLKEIHSFEGFNNEPDMETPYAYYYADRHDRLCEVIRVGTKYMFTTGRGGLPGNNDSGALSSCYMWNAIGIFPVSGQDLMLIGSPIVKSAILKLANSREFKISVFNGGDESIYVERAVLNGNTLKKMSFSVREMMQGGHLELYMN